MVIDIIVPTSWSELSQKQLRFLYKTIANVQKLTEQIGYESAEDYAIQTRYIIAMYCLSHWGKVKVICQHGKGYLMRYGKQEFTMSSEELAIALSAFDWINEPNPNPVNLAKIGKHTAISADLTSLSFENYIACDNLWQGYQATNNPDLLRQIAAILYNSDKIKPKEYELLSIFYWWSSAKNLFSSLFPHFLKPAVTSDFSTPDYNTMRRSVDAQIRALTKGDITKEKEILNMNCWRALTELDALADEYEQLNKKINSVKS